jgi:hypothetical protein
MEVTARQDGFLTRFRPYLGPIVVEPKGFLRTNDAEPAPQQGPSLRELHGRKFSMPTHT